MSVPDSFRALVVEESGPGAFTAAVRERRLQDLPDAELTIRVMYSSLNYKDVLSAAGVRGVTKSYPHTPGIDAAGVVLASSSDAFREGDEVLVTGFDLGMNTPGGFGGVIRVPAAWAVRLPPGLSLEESMAIGTAGFTAALAVRAVSLRLKPDDGELVVTGASGGVGSFSVTLLSSLGYRVTAATGKPEAEEYLVRLGANAAIPREELETDDERPLLSGRWAGAVDTVGGRLLAAVVKTIRNRGVVAACGNVGSSELPLTLYPFILRGVRLDGIDSQSCPMPYRLETWELLSGPWKPTRLSEMYREVPLEELPEMIGLMRGGKLTGRVLVNHAR